MTTGIAYLSLTIIVPVPVTGGDMSQVSQLCPLNESVPCPLKEACHVIGVKKPVWLKTAAVVKEKRIKENCLVSTINAMAVLFWVVGRT